MSAPVVVAIGLLGGIGALARFLLDGFVSRRTGGGFPFGILAVNLSGALALGVLAGVALHGEAERLAAGGLLGAYTTFSTWVFDSHRLGAEGRPWIGLLNVVATLVLGLAAVWLGRLLGTSM